VLLNNETYREIKFNYIFLKITMEIQSLPSAENTIMYYIIWFISLYKIFTYLIFCNRMLFKHWKWCQNASAEKSSSNWRFCTECEYNNIIYYSARSRWTKYQHIIMLLIKGFNEEKYNHQNFSLR